MSAVKRGVKNAFRNGTRTAAVTLILAISIGLSLSMLVANKAVEGRINQLKTQVDRTAVVSPAGSKGMQGGGEPLTTTDVSKAASLSGVETVSSILDFSLQTEGGEDGGFVMQNRGGSELGKTNLESAVEPGTLGRRFNSGDAGTDQPKADFKMPIRGLGVSGSYDEAGNSFKVTSGRWFKDSDTYSAVVGKTLAEKNSLSVGSTFTAYDKIFTVVGIMDQSTAFANDTFAVPLKTAQELTGLESEVSTLIVRATSIEDLEKVISSVKGTLGDRADVTSSQENVRQAIDSLRSVQAVSVVGFVTALVASAVVLLMVMFVIVRERRREIGVLKAIGGSNRTIMLQFMAEAVVLVVISGAVGLGVAFAGSGLVANTLVSNGTSGNSATEAGPSVPGEAPGARGFMLRGRLSGDAVKDTRTLVGEVTASVGAGTILYGLVGMLAIALAGSALPAWLIAKIRPAEVLRGE